jgi:FHA domain-containing protein
MGARMSEHTDNTDGLMAAFLKGAGLPAASLNQPLTPEFMELLGGLLARSIGGTFDLLGARAHLKRDIHADATRVVVRNNNPLKFLPDSQTVLAQMLRKKMPGFMGPLEALDDAYADLKAHQDCVLAGMQGAVGETLRRLDPEAVPAPRGLGAALPWSGKAQQFERYSAAHAQLSHEVADDFHAVLGTAFLQAYERHLERLLDEAYDG